MSNNMIHKELIELDMHVKDAGDFFSQMCKKLLTLGYVKQSFLGAIVKREKEYPTGLPTQPLAVAIPHADPAHIIKPFIAIARLNKSIKWCEMATSDVWHDVKFVFMLGFKRENGHVELLQILVESFQDEEFMNQLLKVDTIDECVDLIAKIKGL